MGFLLTPFARPILAGSDSLKAQNPRGGSKEGTSVDGKQIQSGANPDCSLAAASRALVTRPHSADRASPGIWAAERVVLGTDEREQDERLYQHQFASSENRTSLTFDLDVCFFCV